MGDSRWSVSVIIAAAVALVVVAGQCCRAVVVLEHQETTLTCNISPESPRTSAVFWYSNALYEYLSSDLDLLPELAEFAPSLQPRLSVTGSARRGKYNLRIADVRAEDAGDYLCGYYTDGDEWITVRTVTVEVLTPPGREFPACSVQSAGGAAAGVAGMVPLLPGMLANLSCLSYGGSPPADLAWYRDGVPLESAVAHDGLWVYHQRLIREEDSGVEFTCEATSGALLEPKRCTVVPYRRAPLLRVHHIGNGLVHLGDTATFTCATQDAAAPVTASDGPRYRWYYNGDSIEDGREGALLSADGASLTLPNVTSRDSRAVVSCEMVDEFTAPSSASLSLQLVLSVFPYPLGGATSGGPGPGGAVPDGRTETASSAATQAPEEVGISPAEFAACVLGAFCVGAIFTLALIFAVSLCCNLARKRRGRLDFGAGRDRVVAAAWRRDSKASSSSVGGDRRSPVSFEVKSPVLTFKKPNGALPNGTVSSKGSADCLQARNADREEATIGRERSPTFPSPKRATCSLNSQSGSYDVLPLGPPIRKKPPSLSLFNDSGTPLLSSPGSPSGHGNRRAPSAVDRDYTSSMPDLASRRFNGGELAPVADHHDYVNLPALPSSSNRDEGSGSSTPPSYVNCEFAGPPALASSPASRGQLRSPKRLNPGTKSLSYAKLDLPSIGERPSTPFSPGDSGKGRAGSVSVERTKYAQIAYVFKDRRQQSLPSVKLVGLTEGFGDKV